MARRNPPSDNQDRSDRQANKADHRANRRLRRTAQRDVQAQYQPSLNNLDRQINQTGLDYQNQMTGVESIYGGTADELAKLPAQYDRMTADIAPDLQLQLQQNANLIPGANMPQPEIDAAAGVYGQYGNNAFSQLANNASREANYNQSAQREATLSSRYAQQNLMQDMNDQLNNYYDQQQAIYDQYPNAIKSQMETLRQQQADQASNDAFTKLLESQIGSMTSDTTPTHTNNHNNNNNNNNNDHNGTHHQEDTPNGPQQRRYVTETDYGGNSFEAPPPEHTPPWLQRALRDQEPPHGKRRRRAYNDIVQAPDATTPDWQLDPTNIWWWQ